MHREPYYPARLAEARKKAANKKLNVFAKIVRSCMPTSKQAAERLSKIQIKPGTIGFYDLTRDQNDKS